MSSPQFGRIVQVEVLDPQGRNAKVRPAVIVTPDEAISPDGEVDVVAITTQLDQAPEDDQVKLQYDPRGTCRTQLRQVCAAVCTWRVRVRVADIRGYLGVVPGRQMLEINAKIAERGA